jgi:hypothetical protein
MPMTALLPNKTLVTKAISFPNFMLMISGKYVRRTTIPHVSAMKVNKRKVMEVAPVTSLLKM